MSVNGLWLVKRRAFRTVVSLTVIVLAATFIIVGCHEDVRRSVYENKVSKYEVALKLQKRRREQFNEQLSRYYKEARLAMGLEEDGWVTARVTIRRKVVDWKGSVGSDLRLECLLNDVQTKSESLIDIQVYGETKIKTVLTEADPSSDDVDSRTDYIMLTPDQLNSGRTFSCDVTIRENNGRYAGSYLTMRVTYLIQSVKQLNTKALDRIECPEPLQEETPELPMMEDIPDTYAFTFTHNIIGQIFLLGLFLSVLRHYVTAWKKDEELLSNKINQERSQKWMHVLNKKQLISEQIKREAKQREILENLKQAQEKKEQDRLDAIADAAWEYAQHKESLGRLLSEHTLEELAKVPKTIYFADDLLPYDNHPQGKYGHFSVYITRRGKCYHAAKGCSGANEEIHIFKAIGQKKKPCMLCAKKYWQEIPEWYLKYRKLLEDKKKYNL